MSVRGDWHDSIHDFGSFAEKHVCRGLGGGRLERVESPDASGVEQTLDTQCGIDWFWVSPEGNRHGLATRVQWVTVYPTFTVRKSRPSGIPTELQKRMRELKDRGALGPVWTVQCYMRRRRVGPFLAGAMVRTEDLFEYYEKHGEDDQRPNRDGSSWFSIVYWDSIEAAGFNLVRLRPKIRKRVPA